MINRSRDQAFGKKVQLAGALLVLGGGALVIALPHLLGNDEIKAIRRNVREVRPIGPFDRIRIDDQISADVTLGGKTAITVEAPKDFLPHLKATVENGELHIWEDPPFDLEPGEVIKVHMVTSKLSGVSISGSCLLGFLGTVTVPSLSVVVNGAGSTVGGTLNADRLSVQVRDGAFNMQQLITHSVAMDISGAGSCLLSRGSAVDLTVLAGDKSNVDCANFACEKVKVSASGHSQAIVNVKDPSGLRSTGSAKIINVAGSRPE